MNKSEIEKQIQAIEKLKFNWNNNFANPFSKGLISYIRYIESCINYCLDVYPTACDSIQLEYNSSNLYVEYEIFESGEIKKYIVSDDYDKVSYITFYDLVEDVKQLKIGNN